MERQARFLNNLSVLLLSLANTAKVSGAYEEVKLVFPPLHPIRLVIADQVEALIQKTEFQQMILEVDVLASLDRLEALERGKVPLNEYRMCRPDMYPAGTDPADMEGYYIRAFSASEAAHVMAVRFPEDPLFGLRVWKENLDQNFWSPTPATAY